MAIEVKVSTSPGSSAIRGLWWLRARLGDRMAAGIMLHMGSHATAHGDGIYAMPLSVLWDHRPLADQPQIPRAAD